MLLLLFPTILLPNCSVFGQEVTGATKGGGGKGLETVGKGGKGSAATGGGGGKGPPTAIAGGTPKGGG